MAVSVQNCVSFQNTAKKYETSTGRSHRFISKIPQDFDCRVKANIKRELLNKDLVIKDEEFKTNYSEDYALKVSLIEKLNRPPESQHLCYLRNVEEKLLTDPPAPLVVPLSEMKDSFKMNYHIPAAAEVIPPCRSAKCDVVRLGCEQQPAVSVERKGFWRWTDPYLTSYRSDFIPYPAVGGSLNEKTLTYYNSSEFTLPPPSGNKTMFDRSVFKSVLPGRLLSTGMERIPYFGMQSEYQDHYVGQTFSDLYPYLQDRCTVFEDSLPPASRWQNLAPPGMYCSEYCNIGGHDVSRVVEQSKPKQEFIRTEICCPI